MEKFFAFIDVYVLGLCFTPTFIYTIRLSKQALVPVRKIPLFFLLLGTFLNFSAMCGHLSENSIRAVLRAMEGNFTFDFIFYSRILMGTIFITISGYMIGQIKSWLQRNKQAKINFIKAAACITLLSLPTVLFRPIGILPTFACLICMMALPFTVKHKQALALQQV